MNLMSESERKPHGLMICYPFQGHINPFVGFALKLASHGFTISFIHLHSVHHKLAKARTPHAGDDLFSAARRSGLDIRYATMPDPFPLEFDRDLHFEEYWETMLREFPAIADEFVANFIRSSDVDPPTFMVTDSLYSWWSVPISAKHNLLNVSFWTQPALVFCLLYHLDLLKLNAHFPFQDDSEEEINNIPGVESVNSRDLMSLLKESESQCVVLKVVSNSFPQLQRADFVVHNTLQGLESKTLTALNKYQPNYAIGPINFTADQLVRNSLWSEADCTEWLDSKPPASVLYVSFGSLARISKQEIEEIAYALQLSQVNFIWVLRDGADVLPVGYQSELVKERGLIVRWCNQMKVLESPAVGGFLTHCGWNSILESMWCGVPMICHPLMYDQPTNRKLVVDDWKIGINLRDYGKLVDRKEAAATIQSLMSGDASKRLRKAEDGVKTILRHALDVGGTSEINFQSFVVDLKAKIKTAC